MSTIRFLNEISSNLYSEFSSAADSFALIMDRLYNTAQNYLIDEDQKQWFGVCLSGYEFAGNVNIKKNDAKKVKDTSDKNLDLNYFDIKVRRIGMENLTLPNPFGPNVRDQQHREDLLSFHPTCRSSKECEKIPEFGNIVIVREDAFGKLTFELTSADAIKDFLVGFLPESMQGLFSEGNPNLMSEFDDLKQGEWTHSGGVVMHAGLIAFMDKLSTLVGPLKLPKKLNVNSGVRNASRQARTILKKINLGDPELSSLYTEGGGKMLKEWVDALGFIPGVIPTPLKGITMDHADRKKFAALLEQQRSKGYLISAHFKGLAVDIKITEMGYSETNINGILDVIRGMSEVKRVIRETHPPHIHVRLYNSVLEPSTNVQTTADSTPEGE